MERPWSQAIGREPGADQRRLILAELDPVDRTVLDGILQTVVGATGATVVERAGIEDVLEEVERSRSLGAFPAVLAGSRTGERELHRLARALGNREGTVPLVVWLPVLAPDPVEEALGLGACDVLGRSRASADDLVRALRYAFEVARRERAESRLRLRLLQPAVPASWLDESYRYVGLGRTLAATSHDLNNLLQPVLGYAELLLASVEPETRNAHYARQIERSGRLALSLVSRLLATARYPSAPPLPIEADSQLARAEDLVRWVLGSLNDLVLEPLAPGRKVVLREGALEQIVLNLATNARDAMEEGGRVIVRSTAEGRYWRLEVEDSGVGIPESRLPHLFEAGYTTKGTGKGSGLGLWIVRGLVEEAGGEIAIESVTGRGTRVVVRLPLANLSPISVASGTG